MGVDNPLARIAKWCSFCVWRTIQRHFKAPNAEIYDLVPAVLRAMNLPVPRAFDGKVLDELFIEKHFGELFPPYDCGLTRLKLQKLLEIL